MKKYEHIFFDLDDTLWDFERNAEAALTTLFFDFQLEKLGKNVTLANLKSTFHIINKGLFHQFNENKIDKDELRESRFLLILNELGVPKHQIPFIELGEAYLANAPFQPHLIPDTQEILMYLKQKKYNLHIITNGFEEIQNQKIKNTKINHFFDLVITSEHVKNKKPHKEIFEYALNRLNVNTEQCLMIGDNIGTDILGAKNINWESIWFNPKNETSTILPTHTIQNLLELKNIL
ncbi:MAG: noncanonical pyrimidine nucleotidase, YjjG family [Cytophagia bacterium]|nr:MAG: noncanonical pyrimidine nucleotidase, YjjG family [Cytophagia bacterium]TAG40653.1 MAG: noncanonical pyrimidine nucleotidase, YjjG family [Cytophagia bacterium]